ncbi:MAG: RNA methyltransferase [Deltaproteobacteria bacterium]|nr:MAG: RNA methyltransferase [Deltaproteobacteria bacterium]
MRSHLVRTAVLEIYEEVRRQDARADEAMQRVLRREKALRSVERRAVADAVYGLLRLQGRVDHLLGRALQTRKLALKDLATPTQHLLRYAAFLIVGDEQQSAATAANLAGPEVAPYAWALELVASAGSLPDPSDPMEALAVATSLPRWLAKLWSEQLGEAETRSLAEALNQRAPLTIRANALKTTREALAAALAAEGARVEPTPYSPDGLTFTSRTNVFALAAFKQGLFEVQDEGSQLIAEACNARPGQIVVDACAGAGGKSLALAAAMQNKGRLVACDRDGRRLDEFRLRSRRAGVHNWEARTVPEGSAGERRIDDLRGMADVVLVDAPCSGLGSLRRNPDARWRLTPEEVQTFPPRQREILARYSDLVRPGGLLVYATCSINRAENEDVGAAFLAAHPGFSPEPVSTLLGEARAKEIGAREHDLQLLPDRHGTDGFYLTGFRREGA